MDLHAKGFAWRTERGIDAATAHALYVQGYSWSIIGAMLASAEGRDVKYQPESVRKAVIRYRRQRK